LPGLVLSEELEEEELLEELELSEVAVYGLEWSTFWTWWE
jgi:hypothetical protein